MLLSLALMLLGALMGVVLAAVSPAIVVRRMVKVMENKYGMIKCIYQITPLSKLIVIAVIVI